MVVPLERSRTPDLRHIDDVAVRRDFYTHIDEDVGETVAVEEILSVIEGNAAEVLRALDNGVRPFPASDEHRGHIVMFMAFQLTRDPSTCRRMEAMEIRRPRWTHRCVAIPTWHALGYGRTLVENRPTKRSQM